MYLRIATLIELAADVIDVSSRQTLAQELGIALPTLNAYRNGHRFPESGKDSVLRKRVQELLYSAVQQINPNQAFDCQAYTLSTVHLEKQLRQLSKNFGFAGVGYIASRIVVELFSHNKTTDEYPASTALTHLVRQQPTPVALRSVIGWIFTKYVKHIDAIDHEVHASKFGLHTPFPVVVENIPDFVHNFKKRESLNIHLHIPTPWAWDFVLLAADNISYTIDMSEAPEKEGRMAISQIEVRFAKHILRPKPSGLMQRVITWHRR